MVPVRGGEVRRPMREPERPELAREESGVRGRARPWCVLLGHG